MDSLDSSSFSSRTIVPRQSIDSLATAVIVVILLTLSITPLKAQKPDTTAKKWYDTLEVTKPHYARQTRYERLLLSAFTAVSLPIGIIAGVTTLFPPSISALTEGDATYGGLAVSTGVGFGSDTTALIYFPSVRLQGEFAYYFQREHPSIVRASVDLDYRFGSIHSQDLYWLGVSGGAGISTDFHGASPFAEGWLGVMNPLGINFIGLLPMHNFGLRGRAGYDVGRDRPWFEVALSATSTFAW